MGSLPKKQRPYFLEDIVDISDKIRELRSVNEASLAEEKIVRARIAELKQLITEKAKRDDCLAALKLEEEALLKSLGL